MWHSVLSFFALIVVGIALRGAGLIRKEESKVIVNLLIYVTLPALSFTVLSNSIILVRYVEAVYLIIAGAVIPFFLSLVAFWTVEKIFPSLPRTTKGIFISGATVANLGFFLYPFFQVLYPKEILARLVLFDIGNTVMAYSLTHWIVLKYGGSENPSDSWWKDVKNIMRFPPLWGVVLGSVYGVLGSRYNFYLPHWLRISLQQALGANSLLAMLLLGIHVDFSLPSHLKEAAATVAIRMLGGSITGLIYSLLFGITGSDRSIIVIAAGMPVGLINLVYATTYRLDKKFAIFLISLSIGLGLIWFVVLSSYFSIAKSGL